QDGAQDVPQGHYDRALLNLEEGQIALLQQDFERASLAFERAGNLFHALAPESSAALDALALWIEAARGLEDHRAITRKLLAQGPKLVNHLRGFAATHRGKIAWYAADSLKRERAIRAALPFFQLALAAYQELGDRASSAELQWELAQLLPEGPPGERQKLAQAALDYYRTNRNRSMTKTISRWLKNHAHTRTLSPRSAERKP
ncbi:MAG: hypothetical protein ACPG4T_15075, partial [Nannocystaceae bacterium]